MLHSRATLAAILDAKGVSERWVARQAGLGHATVNHLVTGRRISCTPTTAIAIEFALGCEEGALFRRV